MKLRFNSDLILVWSTSWVSYFWNPNGTLSTEPISVPHTKEDSPGSTSNGHEAGSSTFSSLKPWTLVKAPTFHRWHLRCGWRMFLCCGSAQGAAVSAAGWHAPCSWSTLQCPRPRSQSHIPMRSEHHFPGRPHPAAPWHSLTNGHGRASDSC